MKRKLAVFCAVAWLAAGGSAAAQGSKNPYLTVDELYRYCLGPSVVRAQYCEMYVAAVAEGDRYGGKHHAGWRICWPGKKPVARARLVEIVSHYLAGPLSGFTGKDPAAKLVMSAFAEKFRCRD